MRKVLFTIALMVSITANAQDGYSLSNEAYKTIDTNVNQLDSLKARSFADAIASASQTQYEYFRTKNRPKYNTASYYYIESNLTPQELQDQKELGCSKCIKVNFSAYENRYKFQDVTGSFDDIFTLWKTQFLPSASPEQIKESFKYREVKNKDTGVDLRLSESDGVWQIYNWSK